MRHSLLSARRPLAALALAAAASSAASATLPATAGAQMPGVPVLQGPFRNPGVTVGAFGAGADGTTAAGAAVAIVPSLRWLQFTLGGGYADAGLSVATYGGRAAVSLSRFVPFLRSDGLGVAAFVGIGGGIRDSVTLLSVPVGVTVGYRRVIGTRVLSAYASPFYGYSQSQGQGQDAGGRGLIRVSGAVDFSLTRRIGITVGAEGGATAKDRQPGPRTTLFGAGISFALR